MPSRAADWNAVDLLTDPVPIDATELDEVIRYYADVSAALATQSVLLKKVGDGDTTLLKGVAADAMRQRAMHRAISSYRPDLEIARSETWRAVSEASEATAGEQAANRMPDPVGTARPQDAPPFTPEEEQQSQARTRAMDVTGDRLLAAKARTREAVAAFAVAAERTAAAIRQGWDVDGLHASDWDAFVYGLNVFLKKLVEILGWIGMALAIIGLVVSGIGIVAIMGMVATAVAVVANIILAAQGEASWLSVILGVVSLVTVGVGAIATRSLKAGQTAGLKTGSSALTRETARMFPKVGALRNVATAGGKFKIPRRPVGASLTTAGGKFQIPRKPVIASRLEALKNYTKFAKGKKVKPAWWDVRHPAYIQTGKDKFTDVAGKWRWDKVLGIDDAVDLNAINKMVYETFRAGTTQGVSKWLYFGGVAKTWGWTAGVFGAVANPSTYKPDARSQWPWADTNYTNLTSSRPL